jgi:hypothetical protein
MNPQPLLFSPRTARPPRPRKKKEKRRKEKKEEQTERDRGATKSGATNPKTVNDLYKNKTENKERKKNKSGCW